MSQSVTLKDLATELELSVSTVARALAGSSRISQATRERVKAEADRRGYVVHQAARAMRQGTSSLIGFIAPDLQNDFYATAARAVSLRCQERGLQLVVSVTDDDPATELLHVRNLYASRVHGIVVIPSVEMAPETRKLLGQVPHVQLVRECDQLASDWFGIADEDAMRLGVAHLAALGHRRIAYIGSALTISTGAKRLQGFRRALAEHGLDPDAAIEEVQGCDAEFGHAAMGRILDVPDRPTGVVTAGARISAGAYACARERGVQIPSELSFVGFSDAPAQRWWGEGLTTIGLPVEDIATAAMDCLMRRAAPQGWPPERRMHVMHTPALIERKSTAPPFAATAGADKRSRAGTVRSPGGEPNPAPMAG
jgi:DNA-binding LacI/PurR family transcriptional regulator